MIDTTSSYTIASSTYSKPFDCMNQYYNESSSTTASNSTNELKTINTGSETISGYEVKDSVCLPDGDGTCGTDEVTNFKFIAFSNMTSESPCLTSDGLIGLAPISSDHNGPSLVQAFFEAGMLENSEATLNLNYWPGRFENLTNSIILGGIPEALKSSNFITLSVDEIDTVVQGSVLWTFKL